MKLPFIKHVQEQLLCVLHKEIVITEKKQVYGGDINTTYLLFAGSETYFVKCNELASLDMFQKEYNGLTLLKQKSGLQIPVPFVYGQFENTSYLVMNGLQKGAFTPGAWRALGEGLADMHRQTQARFGLGEDNYIGSLPQPNGQLDTWAEFYAERRVMPLLHKAFDNGLCTKEDVKNAEAVCGKLTNIFPDEPPALLHGDLWSGNVMACENDVALYDPSVYYGHREMDIAMTLLFGGFDNSFYYHYNEVYPLQSGWQQRVALCHLYPLLVHLNLFGSGYYERVKRILEMYR